ncbi:N-6 DNA methylase [Micromonospora sp. C31]|uniref:Eco57I restriction-modification methylase domain-containing protein n=1 Tax=Micromonospora sp. C31 TaxID=2824876 RepID=UPI001B389040|nr:DNA methyltransferase [Micromonospora sp. C31]MBQ1076752.1 N-6 DNA methylase [Micromonospora sp. C31]
MSSPGLQAIHAVGGVVPPGLLARIQAGELKNPAGLAPASYHLIGRETVRDAASRAWSYLRSAWTAWREHTTTQAPGAHGTTAAQQRWLLVLLRELGYGQVPALPSGFTIDERNYPVSHAWQHVPIHLLGPTADLNHRNLDLPGAARAPQAMLQELLNRSDDHLWGILSNGLRLRLLRDSTALAGSAYLEFDLETIFDGELYPEFLLLWQLCHVSRLEQRPDDTGTTTPAGCWLEIWRGEAAEAGTRLLDRLRDGVADAIAALGTGFIRHPANQPLTTALRNGNLSTVQYHRALLRLVYRLLFCFVAEDRNALLHPDAATQARERYQQYFSTARLRRLSRSRAGSPHPDLWHAQRLVLRALGGDGHPGLGLPALAGLFDPDPRLPALDGLPVDPLLGCELTNEDLLSAIRKLAWVALPGQRIQPVDYRNLGAEELGSVYESLLELVPRLDLTDRVFRLVTISGNDRKTTGSYYTPPSLVSALLDTALDPLLDEAVTGAANPADAETRLLALTVCDPACGSGHFLVAAARRIARRLAQVRSGDDEPTPAQVQHALREVAGNCIYGVDLNDLAAELAKVSLWMEALEPGKPLGFLDARIRIGNSLLGATPALLHGDVPDGAFKELEGDDKATAAAVRKNNKAQATVTVSIQPGTERGYAQDAFVFSSGPDVSNADLAAQRAALLNLPDDVNAIRAQAARWEKHEQSDAYQAKHRHADTWCAAFVWPMPARVPGTDYPVPEPPTNAIMRAIAASPLDTTNDQFTGYAQHLATQYRFFHWHLEFPEIFQVDETTIETTAQGWDGGFSCILGNPPWEKIEVNKQEFFASRDPAIAEAANDAARELLIDALAEEDPVLFAEYRQERRRIEGVTAFVRHSGRYVLTSSGRLNTYAVFAETDRLLMSTIGRLGIIVPTGIATDSTTQRYFRDIVEQRSLVALYDFENEDKVFPSVHHSYRFALLALSGRPSGQATLAFRARQAQQIPERSYTITPDEIMLLNPNTGTCPVFVSRRDAEITINIFRRAPVFWLDQGPKKNPWEVSFAQGLFNMATDSRHFVTAEDAIASGWTLEGNRFAQDGKYLLPLYEAKMVHYYDHRFSTYEGATQAQLNVGTLPRLGDAAHNDPSLGAQPRYWVPESLVNGKLAADPERGKPGWPHDWLLGWRDIARSIDERTLIAAVIPRFGVGHTNPLALSTQSPSLIACLQGNLSTYCVDYVARQCLTGTHLTYTVVKQLPILAPERYGSVTPWSATESLVEWIKPRVLELSYTAYDLEGYAVELGDDGPPFVWDPARRATLRAELDAAYFHLYGVTRDDVEYIMSTFKVVRERDEKAYGEYRAKRMILEIFDAMQEASATGAPYVTTLDPPPGSGIRHPARKETLG